MSFHLFQLVVMLNLNDIVADFSPTLRNYLLYSLPLRWGNYEDFARAARRVFAGSYSFALLQPDVPNSGDPPFRLSTEETFPVIDADAQLALPPVLCDVVTPAGVCLLPEVPPYALCQQRIRTWYSPEHRFDHL